LGIRRAYVIGDITSKSEKKEKVKSEEIINMGIQVNRIEESTKKDFKKAITRVKDRINSIDHRLNEIEKTIVSMRDEFEIIKREVNSFVEKLNSENDLITHVSSTVNELKKRVEMIEEALISLGGEY